MWWCSAQKQPSPLRSVYYEQNPTAIQIITKSFLDWICTKFKYFFRRYILLFRGLLECSNGGTGPRNRLTFNGAREDEKAMHVTSAFPHRSKGSIRLVLQSEQGTNRFCPPKSREALGNRSTFNGARENEKLLHVTSAFPHQPKGSIRLVLQSEQGANRSCPPKSRKAHVYKHVPLAYGVGEVKRLNGGIAFRRQSDAGIPPAVCSAQAMS